MSKAPRQKRWGVRTLAFLGLALASVITSNYMRQTGNLDVILLPSLGMLVGVAGAAYCSFRGLRAWGGRLPRE